MVIRSIGDASAALIPALRHISPLPPDQLASLLYRAPSILADGLTRELAESMTALLRRTGVVVEPLHREAPMEPGEGVFDLALSVEESARLGEAAALVSELLGCSLEEGRKIVCDSPSLLMGGVSSATVEALGRRFAALGMVLDVSRPREALYDLFCERTDSAERAAVRRKLGEFGLETVEGERPLVAAGLDWATARRVWSALPGCADPLRLINRDFQRYDIDLERTVASEALFDWLADRLGIAREEAERLPAEGSRTILEAVAHDEMVAVTARLAELGATATPRLIALQRYRLELPATADPEAVVPLLRSVGGLSPKAASEGVAKGVVPGPFGKAQALWLKVELERVGVEAKPVRVAG